jgi:hypothetical protein
MELFVYLAEHQEIESQFAVVAAIVCFFVPLYSSS